MISICYRISCAMFLLAMIAGCESEQPTSNAVTKQKELAAFVQQNPGMADQPYETAVPASIDPEEEETHDTLDLGN